MRAFAAVFAREVLARRLVFPVALGAGFVPLVGSLAYGWSAPDAALGRLLVGTVAATALSIAFALLLGGSVIVGETSEKRISFFYARPISAAAIWSGKLLAAVFVTLASALIAFTPAWLTGPGHMRGLWGFNPGLGETLLGAVALAVLLVLGSHAVVTIGRLRSPWVALDLLLAPALVFLAAIFLRTLAKYGLAALPLRGMDLSPVFPVLAAVVLVALAGASYAQVAAGRTDARRAHGAFSVVLWGILGSATTALGGYAWWVGSAQATDLANTERGLLPAPRGPWVAVGGPLRAGRGHGMFLFDSVRGSSLRIRSWGAAFSANGARAAWVEESFGFFGGERRTDLFVADLASARAMGTGLTCGVWCRVALSPSGTRLAVLDGTMLEAYEIFDPSNPKQLAAIQTEPQSRAIAFVGEDTVRLFPRVFNAANRKGIAPRDLEIEEISLSSKKSLVTGGFERDALPFLRLGADGRFLVGTHDKRLTLHDGRTGALLATLSEDLERPALRFLSEGRMAVTGIAGASARLLVFERGTAPARSIDLGPAASVVLGGEVAPGRVAVALNPFRSNDQKARMAWKLPVVDVGSSRVVSFFDGLVPADRFSWWLSPLLPPGEAGSPSASLFLDADGRFVRLDAGTGARTVLVGRSK